LLGYIGTGVYFQFINATDAFMYETVMLIDNNLSTYNDVPIR